MATGNNNTGVYKILLSAAIGIIITGVSIWLILGQQAVSKTEMEAYVQTQMKDVIKLSQQVETLTRQVTTLNTNLAVLNAKLEAVGALEDGR